jgi:hypothetical protein
LAPFWKNIIASHQHSRVYYTVSTSKKSFGNANSGANFQNSFVSLTTPVAQILIKSNAHFLGKQNNDRAPPVREMSDVLTFGNTISLSVQPDNRSNEQCANSNKKHRMNVSFHVKLDNRPFILREHIEISKSAWSSRRTYSLTATGLTVYNSPVMSFLFPITPSIGAWKR